jgi:hypothetical protein
MTGIITRRGEQFAADRKFTPDEAKALVDEVKANGIVSASEKTQIKALLIKHKDIFQPGAAELLKTLIEPQLPPPPPADGRVVNLDPGGSHRPVFLNASGVFTANADGKPPANDVELGDAIFRAAELVDDAPGSKGPFATASAELRGKVFENLKAVLARVPADGTPPAGLEPIGAAALVGGDHAARVDERLAGSGAAGRDGEDVRGVGEKRDQSPAAGIDGLPLRQLGCGGEECRGEGAQ